MKKILFIIAILSLFTTPILATTWTFNDRPWNSSDITLNDNPSADEYANTNIWWYLYTNEDFQPWDQNYVFQPGQFSNHIPEPPEVDDPSLYYCKLTADTGTNQFNDLPNNCHLTQIGDIFNIHPGLNKDTIIRFKSPVSGNFKLNLLLESYVIDDPNYPTRDGQYIYLHTDTVMINHGIKEMNQSIEFNETLYLNEGDSIYLRINMLNSPYYDQSFTNIFEVTLIPEPSSLILLFLSVSLLSKKFF